jgi:CDP-diacylglycerol--serine O-phosphatidyltransferase
MIREFHLADWFTLGNAVCGTAALFSTITFVQTGRVVHMYLACALVFAALAFDILDGRIARWRQKTSAMGRELDSLADVISFGVTPAMIGYALGMQGLYDRVILAYFVACGVSRLARYNVTVDELSGGTGKGEVLRRDTHSDVVFGRRSVDVCRVDRCGGRADVVWQGDSRGPCVSPPLSGVFRFGFSHDQSDPDPKALTEKLRYVRSETAPVTRPFRERLHGVQKIVNDIGVRVFLPAAGGGAFVKIAWASAIVDRVQRKVQGIARNVRQADRSQRFRMQRQNGAKGRIHAAPGFFVFVLLVAYRDTELLDV